MTKADIAPQMFALIKDEDKAVIANAFVEGANRVPKGAMTYVYNCRRKAEEISTQGLEGLILGK